MSNADNSLILEVLKNIQSEIVSMKTTMRDEMSKFSAALLTLRLDMHHVRGDIQSARGELLEVMRDNKRINTDIQRIKTQIDLKDDLDA